MMVWHAPVTGPLLFMVQLFTILAGHALSFAQRLPELYTDPRDNSLSHTRIGMMMAGAVFTRHMAVHEPQSWELWATYLATVGGYAIGRQLVAGIVARGQGNAAPGP